jgi:TRAP-type C4-dicarboxylate transport system permease large subunit
MAAVPARSAIKSRRHTLSAHAWTLCRISRSFLISIPATIALGIEPIHFEILVECNIALHLACPSVGNVLFIACGIRNTPLETVIDAILPMAAVLAVTMLLIT